MSGHRPIKASSVDPDVDLRADGTWHRGEGPIVAMVAVGGVVGALARYEIGRWWPAPTGAFPWATLAINVLGSGLLGALMVALGARWAGKRLLRPLLGTGVLGGFTTFSTYAVDDQRLFATGHAVLAITYLVATVLAAVAAVHAGSTLTRLVLGPVRT